MLRIKRVWVENFRSYAGLELEFPQPRTLIVGLNNSGKTTLRDVVQWTLTGTCRGLDAAGRGLAKLMKDPARPIVVELDIEGIGRVIRRASLADKTQTLEIGRVDSAGEFERTNAGGVKEVEAAILHKLATTENMLGAVLDFGNVIAMEHAAAKALLLRLLDVRVTITEKDGEAETTREVSIGELDKLEALARENRTLVGRQLRALGTPPQPTEPKLKPLAILRSDMAALRMEGTESFAASNQGAGELRRLRVEIAKLEKDVEAPVARLRTADLQRITDERRESIEGRDRLKAERLAVVMPDQAALLREVTAAAEKRGELANLLKVLDAVRDHNPKKGCVLDAEIPCKTPAAAFKGEFGKLDARRIALRDVIAAADEQAVEADQAREQLAALDKSIRSFEEAIKTFDQQIELIGIDTKRVDEIRDHVVTLRAEVAEIERKSGDQDQTVNANAGKIQTIESQIEEWNRYARKVEDYDKAIEEVERVKAKLARLELDCEVLGPKGIRVAALAEALDDFTKKVNMHLRQWNRSVAFEIEPWRIMVRMLDGLTTWRPLDILSKSEQMRTGVALQLAVAGISGLGFAFIDEAEILDRLNNSILAGIVLAANGGQIIVAATRDADWPTPEVDGLQVVRFELDDYGATRVVSDTASLVGA